MARKPIGTRIKESFAGYVKYHLSDFSDVKPEFRFDEKTKTFFINSCAGLIRFKPRNQISLESFRNKWVNEFDRIKKNNGTKSEYLQFYRNLLTEVDTATYRANIRTRLRLNSGI